MPTLIDLVKGVSPKDIALIFFLLLMACWWLRIHWQERTEKKNAPLREREALIVKLRDICPIWVRKKDGSLVELTEDMGADRKATPSVKAEDLSPTWRKPDDKQKKERENLEKIELINTRAASFYQAISGFNKKHLCVCGRLLQLLDKEDGCSSIVSHQAAGDVETSWDALTRQKLGTITLLDHTLNVAEAIIRRLTENNQRHSIPDAVVAALGHDLGKLLSKLALLECLGDHPLTSAEAVDSIPEFSRLAKKAEILDAIILHHKDSKDNFLAVVLRHADQMVRQEEMKMIESRTADQVPQVSAVVPWKMQREADTATSGQITDLDISKWFDVDQCLREIKGHINKVADGKFQVFSMPKGVVYVHVDLIRDNLLEQARRAGVMEVSMRDENNNAEMKPVIFAAVNIFRSRNLIATDEVDEKYFCGFFNIHYREGDIKERYYTPFNAEAFLFPGDSLEELEQKKTGPLLEITAVESRTTGKKD